MRAAVRLLSQSYNRQGRLNAQTLASAAAASAYQLLIQTKPSSRTGLESSDGSGSEFQRQEKQQQQNRAVRRLDRTTASFPVFPVLVMNQRPRTSDLPNATADLLTACNALCNRAQRVIIANIKSSSASCQRADQKSTSWSIAPASGNSHVSAPSTSSNIAIAYQAENKLWQDLKKFKETGDKNVINYVNGFYVSLLQMVHRSWIGSADNFLIQPQNLMSSLRISIACLFQPHQEPDDVRMLRTLVYNLLIRLGDVNRYLKNVSVSRSYYTQARHLNPGRGHAFNQLALLSSGDPVAQVYFYVRACCATEEPVSISLHNLKSSVAKFCPTSDIIAALFPGSSICPTGCFPAHHVTDWIQVLVIAIYTEKTGLVVKPLLDQALSCLRRKVGCNPFSSVRFEGQAVEQNSVNLLSAVDVLVDHASGSEGRVQSLPCLSECETELKKLQIEVISILAQSDDFAIGSIWTASSQDYQLLGFKPLKQAHEKLLFETSSSSASDQSVKNNEFIFLIKKLHMKIDTLLHVISDKSSSSSSCSKHSVSSSIPPVDTSSPSPLAGRKAPLRSRNVALKSILSGN